MKRAVVISGSICPEYNLAFEETLTKNREGYDSILFLWQNDNTIVIGRNQCAVSECNVSAARKYGTRIVRRITGGGCVFHDLGNLNYSFIERKDTYNRAEKMEFICESLKNMGIPAYASGRNDILASDRKISGNAFYSSEKCVLHHGTVLVNTDFSRMNELLNVPKGKIQTKGMGSVKSRVANISEFLNVSVADIRDAFVQEFDAPILGETFMNQIAQSPEFAKNYDKYNSDTWNMEHVLDYEMYEMQNFEWGSVRVSLEIVCGELSKISLSSDSLFPDLIDGLNLMLNQNIDGEFHCPKEDSMENLIYKDIKKVVDIAVERWKRQYGKI